jgi:exonuclease V gamma subunit
MAEALIGERSRFVTESIVARALSALRDHAFAENGSDWLTQEKYDVARDIFGGVCNQGLRDKIIHTMIQGDSVTKGISKWIDELAVQVKQALDQRNQQFQGVSDEVKQLAFSDEEKEKICERIRQSFRELYPHAEASIPETDIGDVA